VPRAAALQRATLEAFPQSAFAQAVSQIVGRLSRAAVQSAARGKDAAAFWDASVRVLQQTAPPPNADRADVGRADGPPSPAASQPSGASQAPGVGQEAQGMLRELEAMRTLFARLGFKGAPEPLRRIAEAGQGHARNLMAALERIAPGAKPAPMRTTMQPGMTQPAAPPAGGARADVLVRCANQAMGQALADILRESGFNPQLSANGHRAPGSGRAALCLLAAPEATPAVAAYLRGLGGAPVIILDESFGRNRAAWLAQPGVRAVLPVPFEVPELLRAVTDALQS
jgi:hypothetical protein